MWRLTAAIFLLTLSLFTYAQDSEGPRQVLMSLVSDSVACQLKLISWVEVDVEGDLLQKQKVEFERLIRLRLRNDLSMFPHEVLSPVSAMRKFSQDQSTYARNMKQRGHVKCRVWTVGKSYPVAMHVICKLEGYALYLAEGSTYSNVLSNEYKAEHLMVTSSGEAKGRVDESLREEIASIATQLLEARDKWCPKK